MLRALLVSLTALLVLLSMPGYLFGGLIFVALVPLFFAFEGSTPRQRFLLGWLCGFLFFALLLDWLYALWDWAGVFIVLGHLGLAGLLGLWWGLFGVLSSQFDNFKVNSVIKAFFIAALWVLLEYLRSLTKFGFTWGFVSDALYQHPELIQIASLTGAWGVSLLIVLVNFLIYRALRERRLRYGVLALGLIALDWGYGQASLDVHLRRTAQKNHNCAHPLERPAACPQRSRSALCSARSLSFSA